MEEVKFRKSIDAFRDPRAWEQKGGRWKLRAPLAGKPAAGTPGSCAFQLTPRRSVKPDSEQLILVGRGHEDR